MRKSLARLVEEIAICCHNTCLPPNAELLNNCLRIGGMTNITMEAVRCASCRQECSRCACPARHAKGSEINANYALISRTAQSRWPTPRPLRQIIINAALQIQRSLRREGNVNNAAELGDGGLDMEVRKLMEALDRVCQKYSSGGGVEGAARLPRLDAKLHRRALRVLRCRQLRQVRARGDKRCCARRRAEAG